MSLLEEILKYDRELFKVLNGQWTNSLFDTVFPYLRNGNFWMPLYLFMCVFVLVNFKHNGWWWILAAIVTVATADSLNSLLIREGLKDWIFRIRPCSDPEMAGQVRFIANYCPKSSSFMSSHAANHFAMAMFIFSTLKYFCGKWVRFFFLWAFLIVYAQVYVGVHYPSDIAGGAILGLIFGITTGTLFNKRFQFTIFDNQPLD